MKRKIGLIAVLAALSGLFSLTVSGQSLRVTDFEIREDDSPYDGGKLLITINGKKRQVTNVAQDAWIVNGGKEVVYSVNDRTRGFEGEGQSLKIYNVATRKTRHLMSEGSFVIGLTETKLSNGAKAFLISMGDGGLGGSYFAVVDPRRGQVLSLNFAELLAVNGDQINLAFYRNEDWEAINDERDWENIKSQSAIAKPTKVKPEKTQTLDLKNILKNQVIYNKTNEELGQAYDRKYTNLTIYLWRPKDESPGQEYFLMAVGREFTRTISPLRVALESLFAGATKYELETGWESAVFGMKFAGVSLKEGVASIKFSQPKTKKSMPSFAPKMFLEAVEKTAKQFSSVKEVKICEVGGTDYAFEVNPQIPKCQ